MNLKNKDMTNKVTKENLKQLGQILRNNKNIIKLDIRAEKRFSFNDNKKDFEKLTLKQQKLKSSYSNKTPFSKYINSIPQLVFCEPKPITRLCLLE